MFSITSNVLQTAYNQVKTQVGGLSAESFNPFPSRTNSKRIVRKPQDMTAPVESYKMTDIKPTPLTVEEFKDNLSLADLKMFNQSLKLIKFQYECQLGKSLNSIVSDYLQGEIDNNENQEKFSDEFYHKVKKELNGDARFFKEDILRNIISDINHQPFVGEALDATFKKFKIDLRIKVQTIVNTCLNQYHTSLDLNAIEKNYPGFNPAERVKFTEEANTAVPEKKPSRVTFNANKLEQIEVKDDFIYMIQPNIKSVDYPLSKLSSLQ